MLPLRCPRGAVAILLAAVLACLLLPPPAEAQLRGLVRRATDAVTDEQGEAVEFDAVTLELTAERLAQVIRGMQARQAVLLGGGGGPSWAAMINQRDAASNRRGSVLERNGQAISAYAERRHAWDSCRREAFEEITSSRSEELREKAMADPAQRQRIMQLALQMSVAQQRGDTAAVARIQRELSLAPTAADSAAVDRRCGRLPVAPRAAIEVDSLEQLVQRLDEDIRAMEQRASAAGVAASGLNEKQFAVATERLELYVSRAKTNSRQRGFTKVELDAIAARQQEVMRLL